LRSANGSTLRRRATADAGARRVNIERRSGVKLGRRLTIGLFRQISEFYRLVDDHNFDMDRAGGAFGDQNFRQSIRNRLQSIRGLATTLAAQTDDGLRETAVRT
jgi:hypothetical protein